MIHRTTTIKKLFRYKDSQQLLHTAGVVYKLTCSCGKSYIGQTKRNLKVRLKEHKPDFGTDSEVSRHLHEHPEHTINYNQPEILDKSSHTLKLKIKETLYTNKLQPELNNDGQSLPLYLFNV